MVQLETSKVTTEMSNKIFFLTANAVHLIMFKLYRGLDGDPARGDAGGQISRTTALEFQEFYRVFQDLWPFPGFPGSVQSIQ